MKNTLKGYTSYRECFVQEAVYHILSELYLRRFFPKLQFVNSNLQEEHSNKLKSEEQLSFLPEDSNDKMFQKKQH